MIGFEGGLPVSLDGEELPLAELIAALNVQAGAYGIGRIDMIENRAVGIKSRELYEAPAAMTLIAAHQALEDLVLTKAELNAKREIEATWAKTVYDGLWFSPVREALDAFVAKTQELVTGEVRVRLQAGAPRSSGRRSEHALYARALASYAPSRRFPHDAAEGFIRLAAMEAELAAARERKVARRVTLWAGRVERRARAGGLGVPPRRRRRAASRTTARPRSITRGGCTRRGSSTADELAEVEATLDATRRRRDRGDDEDVHSAIERQLGEVGRKIHAGRSRNDQVAAAFRLYVRRACAEAEAGIAAFGARGPRPRRGRGAETPMPGYTHLQRAQPVTVGHHLLAWVEMLERDLERFALAAALPSRRRSAPARSRVDASAAAAGRAVRNSLDAVADRDFALDYLYACAVLFIAPLADRRGARAVGDERVRLREAARVGGDRARR